MTQDNHLWNNVLDLLHDRMSTPSFETWLKPTKAKIKGNRWLLFAPNEFSRDWLESRYLFEIKEAIYSITKEAPDVAWGLITDILPQDWDIQRNQELVSERQTTQPGKDAEELDRVSYLEYEVQQLKDRMNSLHSQVESLTEMLVTQNSNNNPK